LLILADDRENTTRLDQARLFFESKGYDFQINHNLFGDYVLYKNDKPIVGVEYKTCQDFISSMIDNRVFNQAKDISENFPKHYIFIESNVWDYIFKNIRYDNHMIQNVEGAIMSLNSLTTVVECRHQEHAFHRMHLSFQKATDGKSRQLKKLNKKYETLICFLMSIRGIEYNRATSIVSELGLRTLNDLLNIKKNDLLLVEGIGEVYADNIIKEVK
jgi:Fanconi anemia group M protein